MDLKDKIERIHLALEQDKVEQAVMICARVARLTKDYVAVGMFLRELYPNKNEIGRILLHDMEGISEEAQRFVWEKSLSMWIDTHTVDVLLDDDNTPVGARRNILKVSVGEIDSELIQWQKSIDDLALPVGMTAFDVAAFTDRMQMHKGQMRATIRALQTIKSRIKSICMNYAIQIEKQQTYGQRSVKFLEQIQNEVLNYFRDRNENVLVNLEKASILIGRHDTEDAALVLTEVRRALKAAADHFYPPKEGKIRCRDGVERLMGDEQYLNRLQEFISEKVGSSTSEELLRDEAQHLVGFMKRLNSISSKGVHSEVELYEAKQGLVGVYFFLFNLIHHTSRLDRTNKGPSV